MPAAVFEALTLILKQPYARKTPFLPVYRFRFVLEAFKRHILRTENDESSLMFGAVLLQF
jgi:hypothetical protein